jgi:NAD-dependent dihydropyrimidine dehydrogenase PreA subunit
VGYARLPELEKEWQDFNCGVCEEVCPVPTKAIHFNTYIDSQQREIRRPFVREEICVGCGFCEKVCPVLGTSAIVVEGMQPQIKIKSSTVSSGRKETPLSAGNFLPETLGEWKRISGPHTYEGKENLYEYIDGGAEPYLSYTFIGVSNAEYGKAGDKKVGIDIWEFGCTEDAYGVFTKDRAGVDMGLGDGSSLFNNYLYLWNNIYFIKIEPREGNVSGEEVVSIGKSIINMMPHKKAVLPAIANHLPQKHLIKDSMIFFHKKIILDNIYISDNFIEENVFHLSEKTDAVIAEYKPYPDAKPFKLMLVNYPDIKMAQTAREEVIKLWRSWSENESASGAITTFQDKMLRYTSCFQVEHILGMAFLVSDKDKAESLLRDITEKR